MPRTVIALLICCLAAPGLRAAGIEVGTALPAVTVEALGECVIEGGETRYQPWDSDSLKGAVQIVEHTAARAGVESLNQAFYSALAASDGPANRVPITRIVNADDALWGTSGLVAGEVEKNKQATPAVGLVVDAEGLVRQHWQLEKKTAALILLDAGGSVVYFREGGVTEEQAAAALSALEASIGSE